MNQEIADIFNIIADILAAEGDNAFRPPAYRRAAEVLLGLGEDVRDYQKKHKFIDLPGIGKNIADKIEEYIETGKIKVYEEMKKKYPVDFAGLNKIADLGPKRIIKLYNELGIRNGSELKKALESGAVEQLEGFGPKLVANLHKNIEMTADWQKRFLLDEAEYTADVLREVLKKAKQIEFAGSFRRRKDTVGDLDVLLLGIKQAEILPMLKKADLVKKAILDGERKTSVILPNNMQADLRVFDKDEWGAACQYFTGSKEHNIALRTLVVRKGWKLNEYGLFKGEKRLAGASEEGIYEKLGLKWIPPEIREARGEIDLAAKNQLPKLVEEKDIKGDVHLHTNYSDGRDKLVNLVKLAKIMKYEYLCTADHVGNLQVANPITASELKKLRAEAAAVNFPVLIGCEANIRKEGGIDISDQEAEKFDWVIASVHSGFRLSKEEQTQRLLKTMGSPHIKAIGHPTGRLLPARYSIEADWEPIFRKAADRHIALEINAQPDRLDLPDGLIKMAKDLGVKFAIGSDAHSTDGMDVMHFGVGQARRGWLTKDDVLNCWGLKKMIEWLGGRL